MLGAFSLRAHVWGLALACVGCAEPPVVPKAQPLPPAKLHTVLPPRPEFRGYRLSASAFGQSSFRDGAPLHRGAIVGGLRLRTDGTGLLQAESIASPPLLEGVAVPAHLGGGFLFWNESSLFSAATFLSDLKPVIDLEFQPRAVSFGPSSLLVRGEEGQHAVLDLRARERVALADPLLVDVATLPDGRTLELLENGACKLSTDFGKTFRACGLPSGEWASRVFARQDALVAVFGDDAALRLMPGGVEQLVAKEPRPAVTGKLSWWLEQDPPLQAALEAGVPFGEEIAAVFNEGTVASVNLRTGELVQVTRALVPQKVPCELLGALDGPLLACDEPSGREILTNLFGERPTVVAKFSQAVRLAYAEGVLIAAAHCDGSASATSVCVRGTDGTLRELDVAARLGELNRGASNGAPQASVVRWIPKEGGGALALVAGAANGWIDAESGVFQAFSYATAEAALGQPASFGWLDRAWIAPREGGLRGWRASERRGVGILPDGKLEPSAHSFRQLGAAGKYALAFDGPRRAFQSSDWGRSWVETLAPPGIGAPNIVVSDPICSDVGCQLGSWLRVGWLVEPPSSGGRVHVAGTPARPLPPPLPVLTCRERGPAVPREDAGLASPAAVGRGRRFAGEFAWAVKRPLRSSPITVGLRALVEGHVAEGAGTDAVPAKDWPGYHDTLSYSFVSPFEPKGRAERASLTWRARFVAAKAGSGEPPSLEPMVGEASSVPVLGSQLGVVSGLIVDDGAPVWLHERTAEPFTLGASSGSNAIVSAVSTGPRSLRLLTLEGATSQVVAVDAGVARRLFALPTLAVELSPENPDALALGARGELAVLRSRSGSAPASASEPMVLIDERGEITPLAPWSKLFRADAPECKRAANDYRAVLQTASAWLEVEPYTHENTNAAHLEELAPRLPSPSTRGMVALIRVNPERVCLEAVEVPIDADVRVVARFIGAGAGAGSMGVDADSSFRQDLDCALSSPH